MSNSISTLLVRNLIEVFGENDPERRNRKRRPADPEEPA